MKSLKQIASLFIAVVMSVLCLTGCSGKDMSASPYVGVWKATSAEASGLTLDVESVLGGEFTFELKDNGKCVLTYAGETESGSWKETDDGFIVEDEYTMVVEGNTGYMDYDGIRINFESDNANTSAAAQTEETEPVEKEQSEAETKEPAETEVKTETEDPQAQTTSRVETDTFTLDVPEGWVIGRQTDTGVTLLKAKSADDYSKFSDPSFEFSVTEYEYSNPSNSNTLDKIVENDYQFFENKEPTVKEAAADPYTGYLLTGNSASFKNCIYDYYDMESWAEGTDLRSVVKIRIAYFSDEDKKEAEAILDTIDITAAAPEASETADSGQVIETDYFTFVVPEGWSIESESSSQVKLVSDKFPKAKVTLGMSFSDVQKWAEDKSANFGGGAEVWTWDFNGQTWTGVTPSDNMEMMGQNTSDGKCATISCMSVRLEQIPEVIEGFTVK